MFELCSGLPLQNTWRPILMEFDRELQDPEYVRRIGDCASPISSCPIFSKYAIEALSPILQEHGELLPVVCTEGEYFAYNHLTCIEAVDLSQSVVEWLPSGGIMSYRTLYFIPDRIANLMLFKIPQARATLFATEAFVELVKTKGLTGFKFVPVRQSELQ